MRTTNSFFRSVTTILIAPILAALAFAFYSCVRLSLSKLLQLRAYLKVLLLANIGKEADHIIALLWVWC